LLVDGFDLQAHEARLLQLAVTRAHGNLTHAARLLGITRRQLAYRVKQALGTTPGCERLTKAYGRHRSRR
jgi:transcriptional regulator with AAA-type ATPase domain